MTTPQNAQAVTLMPLAGGPGHDWEVSHNGKTGSDPSTYPQVQLPAKSGPYLIHFTIGGGNSIKFAADPIWVQQGSKPTAPSLDGQITAVVASTDGKDLFILDKNDGKNVQLYYKLNFTGHGPVDPIIDNGGGNRMEWSAAEYAAAAFVMLTAFALGMFVYKRYFR